MNNKGINKNHTLNNNKCKTCRGLASLGAPNSRGITLIALIITIIVMLILVGVTVNVALNGGLFETAQKAGKQTEVEADRETLQAGIIGAIDTETLEIPNAQELENNLPEGWKVEETGTYTATSPNGNKFRVTSNGEIKEPLNLPQGWTETNKPEGWSDKVTAITDGTNTIPLPEGYQISDNPEENTIEKGLVIKDSRENEFVWIPVSADFVNPYNYSSDYSESKELTGTWSNSTLNTKPRYDSQEILTELYGTKEGGDTPFYDYETDFAYDTHYAEMVGSVNKYNGFYIGRYETTIDENNEIGSKYNTTVLRPNKTIPQTNNKTVRWYGLYYTERNSNVTGNKDYIQTNMIWGQQWDAMIEYFDSKKIDYSAWGKSSQGKVVNSGQSTNNSEENDKIYNIYDLRTNCYDWTSEANSTDYRTPRGGFYNTSISASIRYYDINPSNNYSSNSSRLTLYIR